MKKITNLLFVMLLLLSSCSKNDDETNDNPNITVPSLTGAITKDAVNFDNPNLKCTDCIIELLLSTKMGGEQYATMTLKFNDNVELIFKSLMVLTDESEADKVYRLLKNCVKSDNLNGSITVNLKNGDKIVSSETFDAPTNADWWKMSSDNSYFTIDLTLNGKQYIYKGMFKYIFPEEEKTETTGAITDKGVDFDNSNLKCIGYSFNILPLSQTNLILQFNDAVEVIIKGEYNSLDRTDAERIYRLLKNCETITVNLKDDTQIVNSETFDNPNKGGNWWEMADKDAYFIIDLNLKGKQYTYKGRIKYIF